MLQSQRPRCQKQRLFIPYDVNEEDDANLDGFGATGAIVSPVLAPGVKSDITSTVIQLLNIKNLFRGVAGHDLILYFINFLGICKSYKLSGVIQRAITLSVSHYLVKQPCS